MANQTPTQPLRFRVPAQDTLPNPLLKTRPGELRPWIESLAWANIPSVVPHLLEAITSLNRIELSYSNRLGLLQIYEPAIRQIREHLARMPLRTLAPVKADLKLGSRVRKICRELAYGYKITIVHATRDKMPWGKNKALATSLCRAMKYLALDLLYGYEHYSSCPSFIWSEIHQIYTTAQARGMATHAVPESGSDHTSETIEQLYKQILLLDLLDPYHLARGEAVLIFNCLRGKALLAEIKQESLGLQQSHFLLDLHSECGARLYLAEKVTFDASRHCYLDTSALLKQVETDLATLQQGERPQDLDHAPRPINLEKMLRYMLQVWRMKPQRRLHRQEDTNKIELSCSVDAAYYFLGGKNPQQVVGEPENNQEEATIGQAAPAHHATLLPTVQRHGLLCCHKLNQSSGGIALTFAPSAFPPLNVGQLLAFRVPYQQKEWMIGVVRWVRTHRDHLAAGVQTLSQKTATALIQTEEGKAAALAPQSALMPLNLNTGLPNRQLLTVGGVFQINRKLILHRDGVQQVIRADRLLESTPGFDRFCYKICKSEVTSV